MARCADGGDLGSAIPFGRPASIRESHQHARTHRQRDQRALSPDAEAGHPSAIVTKQRMNGPANVAHPDPRQPLTLPASPRAECRRRGLPCAPCPARAHLANLSGHAHKAPQSIGSRIAKAEKSAILWVLISKLNKPDRGGAGISVEVAG